jgi:YbbR domain-containing protein
MNKFLRDRLPIMAASLAIAVVFWLIVSGQDTSAHDLSATLELINVPGQLALSDEGIPEMINIRVEANTAQFRFLEGRKLYLRVDASHISPGTNILPMDASLLEPALPRGVKVIRVIPEDLNFTAYPYVSKELPVQASTRGQLPAYLELTGQVEIVPPMARVTGPEHRLTDLSALPTLPIDLSEVRRGDNSLTLTPQLPGLDNWLTVEPRSFRAHVPVLVRTAEKVIEVPISLKSQGSGQVGPDLPISFRPQTAKVSLSWPMDRLIAPSQADISLTVDVRAKELDRRRPNRLDLEVTVPPGVTLVKVDPPQVSVTWLTPSNYQERQ